MCISYCLEGQDTPGRGEGEKAESGEERTHHSSSHALLHLKNAPDYLSKPLRVGKSDICRICGGLFAFHSYKFEHRRHTDTNIIGLRAIHNQLNYTYE